MDLDGNEEDGGNGGSVENFGNLEVVVGGRRSSREGKKGALRINIIADANHYVSSRMRLSSAVTESDGSHDLPSRATTQARI